jgi:hypothetical protein
MTRILAAFGVLAMAAGLAMSTPAQPAQAQMRMDNHRCGRHMHWVPAHRNRYGKWVRGHCAPNR